jgi:hypothetical protein
MPIMGNARQNGPYSDMHYVCCPSYSEDGRLITLEVVSLPSSLHGRGGISDTDLLMESCRLIANAVADRKISDEDAHRLLRRAVQQVASIHEGRLRSKTSRVRITLAEARHTYRACLNRHTAPSLT